MSDRARAEKARRFWDLYIKRLHKQGINPPSDRWHVLRAEQFIKAFPEQHLRDHTAESVAAYLQTLGRQAALAGWQYRQAVRAIQILFSIVEPEWQSGFDWNYWLESAHTLEVGHPTVARRPRPVASRAERKAELVERIDEEGCKALVKHHPEAFSALATVLRTRGMSIRTEKTYLYWLCRLLAFHQGRAPEEMGAGEVVSFLQHLAVERNVAASTQNQALNALVFFYDKVIAKPLGDLGPFVRAKRPRYLPAVLSTAEVRRRLDGMEGVNGLIAALLYGTGMRLMECLRLRVQDIEFDRHTIVVRRGKGYKDRCVPLPETLAPRLREHLATVKRLHEADLAGGFGEAALPDALSVKYPKAGREWRWQFVFPSGRLSVDPRSGETRRHHLHEDSVQKAVRAAVVRTGIERRASCHTLRHYSEFRTMPTEAAPTHEGKPPPRFQGRMHAGVSA